MTVANISLILILLCNKFSHQIALLFTTFTLYLEGRVYGKRRGVKEKLKFLVWPEIRRERNKLKGDSFHSPLKLILLKKNIYMGNKDNKNK